MAKVTANGLLAENALWSAASNRLYLFCWKDKLEALRKTEKISGYEWWLLQDFWTGANGILDTYYVSKHPQSELQEIRNMNAGVQLLVAEPGDNLPLSENASRLMRAYSSNETLATSLHVSNYGAVTIAPGAMLRWRVVASGPGVASRTVCEQNVTTQLPIPQGPGTTVVAKVSCVLPDLGTFADSHVGPLTLAVSAELRAKAGDVTVLAVNSWRSRVYSAARDLPSPAGHTVYTQAEFCDYIPVSNMQCAIPAPSDPKVKPASAVFVVDHSDAAVLQWAARGATIILNGNSTSPTPQAGAGITLPTDNAVFKTAWWLGSATDNNMGTVAYPKLTEDIAPGMAPDMWADEGWFRLIQGGQNYLLDGAPLNESNVEVLLRSIDLITMVRPKALLWQAGVVAPATADDGNSAGSGGALIVSGLNLLMNQFGRSTQCPSTYPHLISPGTPNSKYGLCYIDAASAKAGSGPCGSWCASPAMWPVVRDLWGPTCGSQCPPVPAPTNHSVASVPESAWLLHRLLEYAYTAPKPSKKLTVKTTVCEGCLPPSFVALCGAGNLPTGSTTEDAFV